MDNETMYNRISVVIKVNEFIESRLSEDVSLQAIADHIYLNPGYLSKVYKLETGENISEYLYRLRMNKAADLLRNTRLKIFEISEKIGYQNTPYFIKVFKSHYGNTPQDFRNRLYSE